MPRDQEVTANGRIELECVAEGIPTPFIKWKVNNTDYPCMDEQYMCIIVFFLLNLHYKCATFHKIIKFNKGKNLNF